MILFTACKKEPPVDKPDTPQTSTGDTTKILTLIEYFYNNGNLNDSAIRTLTATTVNGEKKFIIEEASTDDTSYAVYRLNAQNQLAEVIYTANSDPGSQDRDTYEWVAGNISKIKMYSNGAVTSTYDFNYTIAGSNTIITYTEWPDRHTDTLFSGGNVSFLSKYKSALTVSTADFKPLGVESESYVYVSNDPTKPPTVVWDTTHTTFNLSAAEDLQKQIIIESRSDTNANDYGTIFRYDDSTIYNYTRDNISNSEFANVFKGLFGKQLFTLRSFYDRIFVTDYLTPQGYDDNVFSSQTLNKATYTTYGLENGVPNYFYGQSHDLGNYQNSYDNQNRLIKSLRIDDPVTNNIEYGFRIIWP